MAGIFLLPNKPQTKLNYLVYFFLLLSWNSEIPEDIVDDNVLCESLQNISFENYTFVMLFYLDCSGHTAQHNLSTHVRVEMWPTIKAADMCCVRQFSARGTERPELVT